MTVAEIVIYVVAPLLGYLLGSVPFAFVIGKAHGVDIRKTGSGNIGATNLGRTLGKKYFFQAFFLDMLKGLLPTLITALLVQHWATELPKWSPLITGMACMIGHLFPIYLGFKGGKGVATGLGIVLGFWPLFTLAGFGALITFLVVFFVYRYISLSSIIGAAMFFLLVLLLGFGLLKPFGDMTVPSRELTPLLIVAGLFAGLIIVRHRSNIVRLMNGTEPKFGQKKP